MTCASANFEKVSIAVTMKMANFISTEEKGFSRLQRTRLKDPAKMTIKIQENPGCNSGEGAKAKMEGARD
jgi:hypothetical protein